MQQLAWVSLESSVLESVAYQSRSLWVRFRSREIYRYRNVPPGIYQQLLDADSRGSYFNEHIRDAFPCDHLPRSFSA